MDRSIVIIAEHFEGRLTPVTYELLAFALELQQLHPGDVKAVILGDEITGLAREIANNTALDVTAIKVPGLVSYDGQAYRTILGEVLPDLNAKYVCIGHTSQGWDFAPALAVRLGTACITGVERVFPEDGLICFTRTIYNGKVAAEITPVTESAILTIQPGIFKPARPEDGSPGSVDIRTAAFMPHRSRPVGIKLAKEERSALTEAEVIVSAGRGIGKKENLDLIYRLAALFTKSAVGGSRPVCDSGWLEHKHQVGITGATVAPKLYVACGISGAAQHLSGMRGAGFVVAINTDPDAAIFNVADVCITGDLTAFIPAFIREHEKGKRDREFP